MPFLDWMKKEVKDGKDQVEIKLDDETQKKLDKALTVSDDLAKMREQLNGLNSITAYFDEQKREKEVAAEAARRKVQADAQALNDDELQNLILTDPAAAIKKGTQDQAVAILTLRADNVKRDVFENTEKFQYYTGDVKNEIDKLLSVQNLQARNDPSVVENCYWTVLGKHSEELREGKLKSRFASSSGSRGTSTGAAGTGTEEKKLDLEINDDIRKAAKFAGMTPEDYAKMCYDQGVGYV